jgi:hypothetical protein
LPPLLRRITQAFGTAAACSAFSRRTHKPVARNFVDVQRPRTRRARRGDGNAQHMRKAERRFEIGSAHRKPDPARRRRAQRMTTAPLRRREHCASFGIDRHVDRMPHRSGSPARSGTTETHADPPALDSGPIDRP